MKQKITIMGAGHQGLTMAAHLGSHGVDCYLWNRTQAHIQDVIDSHQIQCSGILEATVPVKAVSTDITSLLQKTIMVTTPSTAHKDLAKVLAPLVDSSYTIILNPGRTFGALEFAHTLKAYGCKTLPCIAETQTIVYTCRRDVGNKVRIYALKDDVLIAALDNRQMPRVLAALPDCLRPHFTATDSHLKTSLGNVGMILHCAPVLMNIGWIENEQTNFEYYYDGITPSIARVLEQMDTERLAVAEAAGCPVESVVHWMQRSYQTTGKDLFEHLQNNIHYRGIDAPTSIHHRYLEEDVPNGLVAIESLGRTLDVPTPAITSVISLANMVLRCDYRKTGRDYSVLKEAEIL